MFSCPMHQPIEWDFGTVHPNEVLAPQLPGDAQQPHGMAPSLAVAAFHDFGGSWPSMHQPCVDWDSAPVAPSAAAQPPAHHSVHSSSQQLAASAPQPAREPAKRERGVRRAKSTTLRPQQQQMLELQKKLDVLIQEHTVVEAENQRLKTRLRVLEAVLPVREQQARWAQSKPIRVAPPKPDPKIASLLDFATSGPSSCANSPPRLDTPNGIPLSNFQRACDDDAAVKQDPLVAGSPVQATPGEAAPCASSSSCNPSSDSGATATAAAGRNGNPHFSSATHPLTDSEARWMDAWRAWIREAALLLQVYDARPNEHYLRRLDEAFIKLKSEVVYLGLRHPELVCNMRCVNLETGAEQEVPPDSFWSLVANGMRLTPQQVANCKSALALYRERMDVVLAERRGLAAQLSSCLGALHLDESEGRAAPGSLRREQLTLEAEEVAAALDANVAAEGHTTALARDLLGSNLFCRLQVARASVLSYPYFPDALAIISAGVADPEAPEPQSAAPATGTLATAAAQAPSQA